MTVTVLLWLGYKCIVSPPLSFGSLFKRKEKRLPDADNSGKSSRVHAPLAVEKKLKVLGPLFQKMNTKMK